MYCGVGENKSATVLPRDKATTAGRSDERLS